MRLNEFADAEAQLALLRTIINNTWTAISQQAEQQKRLDAVRQSQAKLKPRAKKLGKSTSIRIPTPPPPPTNKPQAALTKQSPSPLDKPNPNALNAVKPLPPINPQLKQPLINTVTNPKFASVPYPNPKNIDTTEKEKDGDNRYSKNGIATLKKTA